jgi:hypothetical protein
MHDDDPQGGDFNAGRNAGARVIADDDVMYTHYA